MKYTSLFKTFLIAALVLTGNNIFAQRGGAGRVATTANMTIGTIPPGDSIIVQYSVTINGGTTSVSKQHTLTGSNISSTLSNDPKTPAANDPTVTTVFIIGPNVTTSGGTTAFTEGNNVTSTPVVIDGALTVTDPTSTTLASATVSIGTGFQSAEDVLAFTNDGSTMGNIAGSYNAGTGVLTLTSSGATATLAMWQSALRSVTYTNSSENPNTANRIINFVVNDGTLTSTPSTKTVSVTAVNDDPIVTTSGGNTAYTGSSVAIDNGITVTDADNANLVSGTVSIGTGFQSSQDQLVFTNQNGISGSYNSATGVLTLTGSSLVANYQTALRSVQYNNTSGSPNTANRIISFVVNDGTTNSAAATKTVTVSGAASQITDYYRTRQSGNWNAPATWESSPVSDFSSGLVSPATLAPDYQANTITILNTHTVTVTANLTTDQTVINSGGALIVNPNIVLTVNDGTGTDVTVSSGGSMTIKSTSAGTGSIGNSTTATITGNVTVERYISSLTNRAYRLLGPSVSSTGGSKPFIKDNWQEGVNNPGATTQVYSTTLTGPNESPSNASPGTGTSTVTVNNTALTMRVQVTFTGLTGTTTASHIHATTASPGTGTAGVATTTPSFTGFPSGVTSGTYDNTLDMTNASSYNPAYVTANGGTTASAYSALKAALDNGTSYLNIHTSTFPGGEIRGFLNNIYNPLPGYGTHITGSTTGANGFDATITGQGSLFTYNQATPAWVAAANTDATNLNGKTGYLLYIRGDRSIDLSSTASPLPSTNTTLRATGSLLMGNQTFSGLASNGGFSLVTNPFASAVSWFSIYNTDPNNVSFENYYTYWDPNIGVRGGYVTVTDGGVVNPAASGTVNIQSGTAFFVKTKSAIVTPSLFIPEASKSTTNNIDVFRTATPASTKFTASLYFNDPEHGRRLADGVTALYDPTYSAAFDGNDAEEINNFDENIAIARTGKHLSIEERPTVTTNDTLPLFMNNMRQQGYEFEFTPTNFDPNTSAQLVDKFTGNKTILSIIAPSVVPFTITSDPASNASDRFYVMFSPSGALPVTLTSIKAYQKNADVEVDWTTQQEINLDRYEIERSPDGSQFTKLGSTQALGSSSVASYNYFDAYPIKGANFYRIRSIDKNGQFSYSPVVKVMISSLVNKVSVYPNPVNGNSVALQINLDAGTYVISLTNKLGQQIATKVINHPGGFSTEIITPSRGLANGSYQVNIAGSSGINITRQLIKK